MRFAYVLFLILSFQASVLAEDTRLEVPTEDAQKQSLALIRDVFKSDFAKSTPADKQVLAAKLLQQATETRDDAASRYVLYREAEELSAQTGDASTMLSALSQRSQQFKIDAFGDVERLLDVTSRAPGAKDQYPAICIGYLEVVDAAMATDKFDIAARLATKAESAARNARDLPLLTRAQARVKESREIQVEFQKVRASVEKLATVPDDSESNLTVGRYQCFIKNNWPVGLPLLAKGSDKTLKELAEKELASAGEPEVQLALADAWWPIAEKLSGNSKEAVRKHAGEFYKKAFTSLSGLHRARVERRIDEIYATVNQPTSAMALSTGSGSKASPANTGSKSPGVNPAIRKLFATAEELDELDRLAIAAKNDGSRIFEPGMKLIDRIRKVPASELQKWNEEEFKAALQAEEEIRKRVQANRLNLYSNGLNSRWNEWALSAPSATEFLPRLKLGRRGDDDRKIIHKWIGDKPELFPTTATKLRFCEWLKQSGINSPSLDEYVKDIQKEGASGK